MLEQPPERSEWEIQAEIAAVAEQRPPANRAHGCFRVIIWCSPVIVVGGIAWLLALMRMGYSTFFPKQTLFFVLAHAATFGIGYFDGMLSRKTFGPTDQERRSKLHVLALKFLLWQYQITPALGVLLIGGACMVIYYSTW